MADVITFIDFFNTVLVNLNATPGLTILFGTGVPERAPDQDMPVIETYQCKITGTNDDDLASQLNSLNRVLDRAARYDKDSTEENEIWMVDKLSNETNGRKSLILGGTWKYDINPHSVPTSNEHTVFITLSIKRMPYYEGIGSQIVQSTGLTVFGGSVDLSTEAVGDMPSRTQIYVTKNTGTIDTLWLGFRSELKHPSGITNFAPLWEAEKGTMGTNTATTTSYDASSTGTTPKAIIVSFANANWDERVRILASDISGANAGSQAGRFLVLGRMRLDTGTDTIQARLRSGWYSSVVSPQYKTLDPVTISGTDFKYYELGTVKFPPIFGSSFSNPAGYGVYSMYNAALSLLAARTSGSTSKLVVDHFAMVPIDEGYAKISGAPLGRVIISTTPKNTPLTASFPAGYFDGSPAMSQNKFFIPVGTNSVYVFGQRSGISVIGDTVDFQANGFARYYSLRGAV